MTPVLRAEQLYRFYRAGAEETLALRGVSLSVDAGETVAVTGPSGSGKSTLLACLSGIDEPDGGFVHLGTERMSHRPEMERAALRGRRIGVLLQAGNLMPHLTVAQNIELVQRLVGRRERPTPGEILDAVGLADRMRARPGQLSGGEATRAGLAVALANAPSVLLADEPTGELDDATEAAILDLLRRRAEAGCAVLVVSHSGAVAGWADRVLHLRDGAFETAESGAP
ncbi:ABC transporter ATP-binding protein [Nocardia yunnanensis]|uniref:ABC transporter ATP-binding protein n=1 Tax=Nocardia yunnanensis TaxID=2382165 RepID=UPI001FE517EE|nr:ABC transporter ATP-binding protein [Nocardia yunnanensis]